ncbi:molecular chaperone DnaK [Bacillus sp. BGMRC 2118]|nr:molecular chaperone DnaK [Bacillus sp. BGMRC 2118]
MNMELTEIHSELLMMKQELESRLMKDETNSMDHFIHEPLFTNSMYEKKHLIQKHIHDDLQDVERALSKLEYGIYGICEETGERIPLDKLKTLPTARSIFDFSFHDLVRI